MTNEFMQDRRRGLEEEFFARENRELLERLRKTQGTQEKRAALKAASGIEDDVVLDRFVEMQLSPETVVALTLAPLVQVAWADETLDSKEREAILRSARERAGLAEGDLAYDILAGWLNERPDGHLFDAWQEYAKALVDAMDEDSKRRFRDDLIQRLREVAEAAGGTFGMRRISDDEREAISQIEQALS